MKKNCLSSCARLFGEPVAFEAKEPHKLYCVALVENEDGSVCTSSQCIEDEHSKRIALDFRDAKLDTLVKNGVDSHALDMIDTNKIGVDAGVDALANHIMNNSSCYVESPKFE